MNTKMKMRILSLLLCFVMLVGLMPTTGLTTLAQAAQTEESYAISITNKPGTTFVLSHDEYTYDVCDLWKEVDSDGTGELKFDQSFSVNINDAIEVYNNYIDTQYPDGDREHYKASEENYNGSIFYVEARVLINNYEYQFSSEASYKYAPYGLDGEYNEGCGEWNISSYYDELSDFFTMSKYGGVLDLSLDGTVKEIYEALKAQDETLGDVTINNLEFQLRVSCQVEYRSSWGNINYTELGFDGVYHTLYDKHIYGSTSEYDNLSVIPVTAPITVNVGPMYEDCYVPVKTEYSWYYEFVKEGYDTDEDDTWYGYFEKDESKESDVLTETAPSGTVYGIAYGTVDSGENNSITLDDILNENNKDFINSFIGEKPRELGGKGQMLIECAVTLTFEDGKQWVVYITKADYMSRLIIPCMHACTVCGLCTVTDEMLPCNFDRMNWDITNVCSCDEPSVPEYEITVESKKQMTIESTGVTVDVVVEQVDVEEIPVNSFIVNATEAVGADNVMAFYNIDIFDEEGYPYTLNQYYDEGEELTISISVSMEEALALQKGEAALYHILANGTAEEVEGVTVAIDGESATMTFTSSSFSPYIVARTGTVNYYGRNALSALTNATALLYAYDQLVAGVENCDETIAVYNGVDPITEEELATVLDAYIRDYTHHFWLGSSFSTLSDSTSVLSLTPTYTVTGQDLAAAKQAFDDAADTILAGLTAQMSEYERELYLHDQLAALVTYQEGTNAHNAYGALVEGIAVCEGYAEAMQYLLRRAGIQSFIATGTSVNPATGTLENHAWNYVRIDGEYYHTDLTWDDQGKRLFHAYFNQTDAVIQEGHNIGVTAYALPTCDSTEAQYFTGKDAFLSTYTPDSVGKLLKDNGRKVHVYIPGSVTDFLSWYNDNILDIAAAAGIPTGLSYGYLQLGRELVLELIPNCQHTYGPDYLCTVCGTEEEAYVSFYSLSLTGNIAINYYMHLSDDVAEDATGYMRFITPRGGTVDVPLSQAVKKTVSGKPYYVFTVCVAAKEMTDTVTGQYFYGSSASETYSYSVKEYADIIIANTSDNPEFEKAKPLVQAMLTYGAYAQANFGYNTGSLAAELADVSDVTASTLIAFANTEAQGTELVPLYGASLTLQTQTTLRLFFLPDTSVTNLTATMEGKPLTVNAAGELAYVDIPDINAKNLDANYAVTINDGTQTATVYYNPMTYCYSVLNAVTGTYSDTLLNTVRSLYLYNQAANNYLG